MGCLFSKESNGDTQESPIYHKDSDSNTDTNMKTRAQSKRSSTRELRDGEGASPSKNPRTSEPTSSTQSPENSNQEKRNKQQKKKDKKAKKKKDKTPDAKKTQQSPKLASSEGQPLQLTDMEVEGKNDRQPMQIDKLTKSKLGKSEEKYACKDDTNPGIEMADPSDDKLKEQNSSESEKEKHTDKQKKARENDAQTKEQKSSESETKQQTVKQENAGKSDVQAMEQKSTENEMKEQTDKREKAGEKKIEKEINKKLKDVQQEKEKLEQQFEKTKTRLQNLITNLKNEVLTAQQNLSNADKRFEAQKNSNMVELSKRDNENSKLKAYIVKADEEKESLLTRLSALAGARLLDNNPNIADLSDKNRPTKLAEQYSELYDNEWTDAFTTLQDDGLTDEIQCITVLLTILTTTYLTCEEKAKSQHEGLLQSVSEFLKDEKLPPEMSKHFKETRKKNYKDYLPELTQVLESKLTSIEDVTKKRLRSIASFHNKCLEICWLMCIQDPPMYIDCRTKLRGEKYYKGQYKEYTRSGPIIDYVVWPPVYLQKDGPILCKGTVQCTQSKDDTNITQQKPKGSKGTVLKVDASKSVPSKSNLSSLMNDTLTTGKKGNRSKSANFSGETKGFERSNCEQKLSKSPDLAIWTKDGNGGEQTPAKFEPNDSSSHL